MSGLETDSITELIKSVVNWDSDKDRLPFTRAVPTIGKAVRPLLLESGLLELIRSYELRDPGSVTLTFCYADENVTLSTPKGVSSSNEYVRAFSMRCNTADGRQGTAILEYRGTRPPLLTVRVDDFTLDPITRMAAKLSGHWRKRTQPSPDFLEAVQDILRLQLYKDSLQGVSPEFQLTQR